MFGWFLGYITVVIFQNFEIALVLLGQFIKFSKMHLGNFSQIALSNMWLIVLIQEILATVTEMRESEYGKYEKIWKIYKYTAKLPINKLPANWIPDYFIKKTFYCSLLYVFVLFSICFFYSNDFILKKAIKLPILWYYCPFWKKLGVCFFCKWKFTQSITRFT